MVWVRPTAVIFPLANQGFCNSHLLSKLLLRKALFKALGFDIIAQRFRGCWEGLSRPTSGRKMTARSMYGGVCNTQQSYSPPMGERVAGGRVRGPLRRVKSPPHPPNLRGDKKQGRKPISRLTRRNGTPTRKPSATTNR